VTRLAALLVLTAAFAPAAVLGAMPLVAPVVVVVLGVALLATTVFPGRAVEPVRAEPGPVTPAAPPR
jgi:hypothetical protein